jgi:hypothetical protein
MKYELRRLSFGETLGQAFNLYFDNFVALFMISLVCSLPAIFFMHITGFDGMSEPSISQALSSLILFILNLSMATLCTALTIELISRRYLKQLQDIRQYIRNVIPFIFSIIGLTILETLIIGLGFFACVIPGIYLAMALSVAPQALIVERQKVMKSIKRSFFLTRNKKLEILGFWVILVLIYYVIGTILKQFYLMILQMDFSYLTRYILIYTIEHLSTILMTPINSCVFILVYFNLRIEKEGFDLEHLVDQFETGPVEVVGKGSTDQ